MKIKKLIVCIVVILVCSILLMRDVHTQEGGMIVLSNVCRSCGDEDAATGRFCTNCGDEIVVVSPGAIMYTFIFSDILEKNNLKIEQKNRGWCDAALQKITKDKVFEFYQLGVLTREYCKRESLDLVDMVSRGVFYAGKNYLGLPVTKHYTEVMY